MKEIQMIRNTIVSRIQPEKIYFLNMGPIYQFLIIWDRELSDFEKRVYIRGMLRFVSTPFDVTVYSSQGYERAVEEREPITMEVVNKGVLIYENPTYLEKLNEQVY